MTFSPNSQQLNVHIYCINLAIIQAPRSSLHETWVSYHLDLIFYAFCEASRRLLHSLSIIEIWTWSNSISRVLVRVVVNARRVLFIIYETFLETLCNMKPCRWRLQVVYLKMYCLQVFGREGFTSTTCTWSDASSIHSSSLSVDLHQSLRSCTWSDASRIHSSSLSVGRRLCQWLVSEYHILSRY